MADEKSNADAPVEENGTVEPVNGNEEASEPSSTLEKDEDEGKKDEDEGKGDEFFLFISFFTWVIGFLLCVLISARYLLSCFLCCHCRSYHI